MAEPAPWPVYAPDNPEYVDPATEAVFAAYHDEPVPSEPDLTSASLAAGERIAQRALAETACATVSVLMTLEDVTFRMVWRRRRAPEPSAWKFWRW